MKLSFFALLGCLFSFTSAGGARAETRPSLEPRRWPMTEARKIAIQNGGRVKPLEVFARESVLLITGKRKFQGWDSLDLLFSWLSFPQEWQNREIIQITRQDVRRQIGLPEDRTYFSPDALMKNSALAQYASRMGDAGGGALSTTPAQVGPQSNLREQELKSLLDRIGLFRSIVSGFAWSVLPRQEGTWGNLAQSPHPAGPGGELGEDELLLRSLVKMVHSYQMLQAEVFVPASQEFLSASDSRISKWNPKAVSVIRAEVAYFRMRPFLLAWISYLIAALIWVGSAPGRSKSFSVAMGFFSAGFFFHLMGIVLRCYIAGRPPVTNMYESIIWVSFGQALFAGALYFFHRYRWILVTSSVLATLGLIAADAAPTVMSPGINPLVPVLRSNYWLTIHVLTITLSYAAFALTFGFGMIALRWFASRGAESDKKAMAANQLAYRAMQIGIVLLAAGTILGGVWADYSWGRFWGWDPKEVWALIALLCYIAILHGRLTNWVKPFGFAVLSVLSFLSVLMAWYGVNFILGVGLHSYGFSTGGAAYVAGFTLLIFIYVGWAAVARKLR